MAQTENYQLDILTSDDFVTEAWVQRLVKVLDRALGEFLQQWMLGGVISGWSLGTDKTVSAGEGVVNGCHCKTTTSTDISGILASGATNYVYATNTSTSAPDGDVAFQATQVAANIPSTAVRLGKIVLDAAGNVTEADDNPADCPRDYAKPLRYRRIGGQWSGTITAGTSVYIAVDHSSTLSFDVPLGLEVSAPADVHCVVCADGTDGGQFRLKIWNDSTSNDVTLTWTRYGFA
ncbi:hypothetical protein [Pseudomonas sp.]|uniref:hypothetical protein n=1 Tax=Pseudomonas sp. TaxID=306 RepID=UPI003D13BEEC